MTRTGKTALVTGASAGLGAELSRLFAADGHDVVLVARRQDKLEALAVELHAQRGVRATVLAEDLTDSGAPGRIATALDARGIAVEFLVNNAGFGTSGAFAGSDLGRERPSRAPTGRGSSGRASWARRRSRRTRTAP